MEQAVTQKNVFRRSFLWELAGILLLSLLLHLFTLDWDLPGIVSPEVDGIPPNPGMTAEQMCRYETHKYPMLQYIIAAKSAELFLKPLPEGVTYSASSTHEKVWQATSRRILLYRSLSAAMGALAAMLLYGMARAVLGFSLPGSLLTASFLIFPPAFLHYSHTTNMDVPALFWCTTLLFSLVWWGKMEKEGAKERTLFLTSLLSGVLLGCAFATKDQIYAVTILPFFFFLYRRIREKKRWFAAVVGWGAGFLLTVLFIYFVLCKDKAIFSLHFAWIVSSGSDSYAMVTKTLAGYGKLFGRTLWDMISLLDWPFFLFLLGMGGFLLYRKGKEKLPLEKPIRVLGIYTGLAFLSHFFFFSFVVRYNFPRYMLTLLPLFALLGGGCFELLYRERKKPALLILAGVLLLAGIQSSEFLFLLTHTPGSIAKKDALTLRQEVRLFTALSERGYAYSLAKEGNKPSRKHTIRDWSFPLGLRRVGIQDIPAEDLHIFLFEPEALLREKPLTGNGFIKRHSYSLLQPLFPRLYKVSFPEYILYTRDPGVPLGELAAFRKGSLSWQLVLLRDAFSRKPRLSKGKAARIGAALAPFREEDLLQEEYWISRSVLELARDLYMFAGRKEDAAKVRNILRKI